MPQDNSQTPQIPAPQPAETPADTPTARYRQISDRYGEKTGHKIDVTLRDRTGELDKTQKAQQAFDDAPIGKEEKAEKALEKARKAYEEAKAELESWKAVKEEHDRKVAERVRKEKADTATVNNVLNVIDTEESRANVILQAAKAIKPEGTAYFSVYEGDKSGNGRQTKSDSWQNNLPTREYVREVERYFEDVSLKNGVITARVPIETDEKSVWDFDGKYDGNGIRFSEREEEGSDRSLFEQQLLALDKLAESHKENLNIRRMAIEAMNGQMKVSAIFFA